MDDVWFALFANLSFVISNVIFRKTEHEASPAFINLIRTGIGVISFLLIAIFGQIFSQIFEIPPLIWVWLILSFVFGQVIGDTAFFIAQKRLGTTQALAISMTFPVFTYIFSIMFLGEKFNAIFVIAFFLILSGVMCISKGKKVNIVQSSPIDEAKPSKPSTSAIVFGLIASIGWAIGLVVIDFASNQIDDILQQPQISSLLGNVIRFPFAFLMLIGVTFKLDGAISVKKGKKTWFWLLLGSIIGTTLGAHLYTEAARTTGASIMSLIASASPLFALPFGYFVNKEKISWLSFIGVLLTICGVVLIVL